MSNTDLFTAFLKKGWQPNWRSHPPADNALLEMVIVEPRTHPNLPHVLANFSHMFPHAALTVFHGAGSDSTSYIQSILPTDTHHIRTFPTLRADMTVSDYNRLLMSREFWGALRGERILIFQTDSGVIRNTILNFMHYDYIGAPWTRDWSEEGDTFPCFVGNGGLSLRSRWLMEELCELDHPLRHNWTGPEDIYFARAISLYQRLCDVRLSVPTLQVAATFSVEAIYHPNPMGFHKAYECLSRHQLEELFSEVHIAGECHTLVELVSARLETDEGNPVETLPCHDAPSVVLSKWLKLACNASGIAVYPPAVLPLKLKGGNTTKCRLTVAYTTADAAIKTTHVNLRVVPSTGAILMAGKLVLP
jgi:hypothetical protein